MRNFILILITVFNLNAYAQKEPFEGYILYRYTYLDLEGNDITAQKLLENDSVQHYYINAYNYVAYDENQILKQLYNASSNRYFFSRADNIYVLDAGENSQPKPKFTLSNDNKEILGFNCTAIVEGEGPKASIRYVSEDIWVDHRPFKHHVMGGWGPFLEASNGKLPLELIFHNQDHTMIMTAVLVQSIQIPEEAYDIDKLIERSNN